MAHDRQLALAWGVTVLGVIVLGLVLAGRTWFPPVYSEHGSGVQRMLNYTIGVTGAFFIVGHLVLAYLAYRFTRRPPQEARPIPHRRERTLAWIPAIFMALAAEGGVLLLGLPVWGKYYGLPPENALRVEVTGRQFMWIVRYPGRDGRLGRTVPALVKAYDNPVGLDPSDPAARDDVVLENRMVVPVGRPVQVLLRSQDVLHSFFLPEFRVKQDAVPGMTIRVWFTPTRTGTFEIACNQICGLGHYRMRGFLEVVEPEAFEGFLAEQPGFFEESNPEP